MTDLLRAQPLAHLIDQIIDGSLGPGELRLALSRLDHEPDGWKRCTLAFLEAQCWREAFRALEGHSVAESARGCGAIGSRQATVDQRRTRSWRGAAAAGIIAASFALGWVSHRAGPREVASPSVPASSSPIVADVRHDSPTELVIPASDDAPPPAGSDSGFAVDRPRPSSGEFVQTVGQLRIGPDGAGATVPILAGPGINGDWLQTQQPPLSEYEQALLQRHGYQVDQRRRLLSATLADGRRVSVPVDQVEIRYTGINPL
jgi:hypothetical protein